MQTCSRFLLIFWCLGIWELKADGSDVPTSPTQQESIEVSKKFAELSKKVNQQPELKKLKADLDAAQQAYITAFEAAMTKEDPQIIAQYKALREEMMQKIHHPLPPAGVVQSTAKSGYNQLSDAERQRLYEARKAAVETPAVRNARQKRNAAKTEEERNAADAEYRIALGKAMIEQDPKLQEVIDKMEGKASTKETASALPAVSPTASGSPSPSPAAGIK